MNQPTKKLIVSGEIFAVGLIAQALAYDVWLIKGSREPISTCVRRSILGRVITAYLAAHLLMDLPWDPLRTLGERITPQGSPN